MKILVSLGPFIGLFIYVAYYLFVRIYIAVNGKESVNIKKIYIPIYVIAAIETVLLLITIIVPRVSDQSYVIGSMTIGGKVSITRSRFKVSYIESGRDYSDRISLSEEELEDVRAVCSSDKGKVFLQITQDDKKTTVDITNADVLLDMSEYEEGDVRFTLVNENARNVKFELIW